VSVGSRTLLLACPGREAALRDWLERHGTLMAAAESHAGAVPLVGRGRVAVVPSPATAAPAATPTTVVPSGERWVVRHYHRGGAVARVLGDRYLRLGTPRPFRELRMLEAVRALGVPSPEPVGGAAYVAGPFYRGDLVTCWVPDSVDLATLVFGGQAGSPPPVGTRDREWYRDEDVRGAAMGAAGRLVRLLHDRGVDHPDLNLKNILVAAPRDADGAGREPRALILDLDRVRLGDGPVPGRGRGAMLARFWRSAAKWERRTGRPLSPSLRSAFEAGYARAV
jgi:3-deoxy-D-manno-octulosonic acid kinase